MKQFLTLIFLFLFSCSFAQFAIVNDKNSLLNVREDAQPTSKVVDKLPNAYLFYCFENKGNSSVLLEQRFKLIKEGASKHKAKADALIM